jgi:hypothetical protein
LEVILGGVTYSLPLISFKGSLKECFFFYCGFFYIMLFYDFGCFSCFVSFFTCFSSFCIIIFTSFCLSFPLTDIEGGSCSEFSRFSSNSLLYLLRLLAKEYCERGDDASLF